ncbi:MAG: YggT family protein [Actinobacteria bacterium]|nr:YggT family protein [Actinomycetota bacterium]
MTLVLCLLLQAYWLVLFLHVIFSWVPRPPEPILPVVHGVRALVEPLAAPLRRTIPPLRLGGIGLDLSIIVLFLAIWILQIALCR